MLKFILAAPSFFGCFILKLKSTIDQASFFKWRWRRRVIFYNIYDENL